MGHRPKYKTKTIKFLEDSIGGNLDNLEFGNDFFFFFNLFLAALGLCCCTQAFSLVAAKGATLRCSVRASHCGGLSCCRAQALGAWASVVVACRLSSCGARA